MASKPQCETCEEPLDPDDLFCGRCGNPVDRSRATQIPKRTGKRTPGKVPRRKLSKAAGKRQESSELTQPPEVGPGRQRTPGRPSRWWPESATGRVAFPVIAVMAGVFGLVKTEGNVGAAAILAAAALFFLTFWRSVWLSWAVPSSAPVRSSAEGGGETEGSGKSGTWQAVAGFVVLLILLAIVRSCGKDIIRAIL